MWPLLPYVCGARMIYHRKGGKMCTINSRAQLRVRTSLLFREAQ